MLFDFLRELISQRGGVRLAIDRNLARGLIVSRDPHVRRRQTFVKVQQNLDRVVARVDRRCERFPLSFGLTNELRLRRVARNQSIKSCDRETGVAKIKQKEQKDSGVGAAGQNESFLPFAAPNQLDTPLSPTVRQEIEFNGSRRRLDTHKLGRARQNSLDRVTQLVTTFIEQNVWKRTIDSLQLGAHGQLRQFHLQLFRRDAVECTGK